MIHLIVLLVTTKSHVLYDMYLYIPKWSDVGHPVSPETKSTSDSSMTGHVEKRKQTWSMALNENH
jgi:hypothetical protein